MSEIVRRELIGLIDGLAIREADLVEDYNLGMILWLSRDVEDGIWNEQLFPDEFARLRQILIDNRDWYREQPEFMRYYRSYREEKPRTHWWWWMEEL